MANPNRGRRVGGRAWAVVVAVCLAVLALVVSVTGCGDIDRAGSVPFDPPLLKERDPTHVLAALDGPYALPFTHSGVLYEDRFVGVSFDVSAGVALRAESSAAGVELALALYGPRSDTGVWGSAIASNASYGARLEMAFPALAPGRYLALLTSTGVAGSYLLEGNCLGECAGATAPECPAIECGFFCPTGFVTDAAGCATCACVAECMSEFDCPEGTVCSADHRCVQECQCNAGYAPVCGTDGQTYANACEARCAGVDVADTQACAASCPAVSCSNACVAGFAVANDGCPTCTCQTPCEQCDDAWAPVCSANGQTFLNPCRATCRGERVATLGSCRVGCAVLACELACPAGYAAGEDGCPICACAQSATCARSGRVCGENAVTYSNTCAAQDAGVAIAYDDSCPSTTCMASSDCPKGAECVLPVDQTQCLTDALNGSCVGVCMRRQACDSAAGVANTCAAGYVCSDGLCSSACLCSLVYDPVCGVDGATYDNACAAACAAASIAKPGRCCDAAPACDLACAYGYALDSDGCETCRCREAPCACTNTSNPVCVVSPDGIEKTYLNSCWATCDGYDNHTHGSCDASGVP